MKNMKKLFSVLLSVMMLGLLAAGCGSDKGGSSSGLAGAVSTNGSTSMEKVIGILSEKFMEDNKGVTITYDASGSGTGIEAVSKGSTDIGLSSRALKDSEKAKGLKETTVALDGIAIPPEELPLVFDRFHKLDKSRSQNRDGWGLGLYIVKTIICCHGENISVSSKDGKTEFTFTMPLVN